MLMFSPRNRKYFGLIVGNFIFFLFNYALFSQSRRNFQISRQNEEPMPRIIHNISKKASESDPSMVNSRYYIERGPKPIGKQQQRLDRSYVVPKITYNKLISCAKILTNDTVEIAKALQLMDQRENYKVPFFEEEYFTWTRNCAAFKKNRGYVLDPLTEEEAEFPLAFSISMYKDVEQVERLLRAIYRPQNFYCIHIDVKSPFLLHMAIYAIVKCFPNVFIASKLDKIKWGDVSVLLPAINCMRDLVQHYRKKFKYFINLTGQEFPLRTNYELVKIAKVFNGSNDISGTKILMDHDRVNHKWSHRWSKTYQQTIFYDTTMPKAPFTEKLEYFKGELHGLFSHNMVEYIVNNNVSKQFLSWCWNSGHPSEHYWNTLNYNTKLKAPGGYAGPLDLAHEYSYNPIIRFKHWQDKNYVPRECQGQVVRGICILGVKDLPYLTDRYELFVNKFFLTFQSFAYDCVEELHRNRSSHVGKAFIDVDFYKLLPTVKYGRKDGLS